jgi:hypothetical protein
MSGFADIDSVIAKWVRAADTTLYTEWADVPARFFHIPPHSGRSLGLPQRSDNGTLIDHVTRVNAL